MVLFDPLFTIIGVVLCIFTIVHALKDVSENRVQRLLMLLLLFIYAVIFEFIGVITGIFQYAPEIIMILEVVPLSIPLTWVSIIYSATIISERLKLPLWQRILVPTLIALSLDWGIDPIAVELGAWTFTVNGPFFGVPSVNFIGWFFIPIAYLVAYRLNWNRADKRPQLLSIKELEENNSLGRKLYTCFLVVPISIGILFLVGMISRIPFLNNMPIIPMVIWLIVTVVSASGAIVWKRNNLKRIQWIDVIPPIILFSIGIIYAFLGLVIARYDLVLLMLLTGIPLLLAFIFTLRKLRERNSN